MIRFTAETTLILFMETIPVAFFSETIQSTVGLELILYLADLAMMKFMVEMESIPLQEAQEKTLFMETLVLTLLIVVKAGTLSSEAKVVTRSLHMTEVMSFGWVTVMERAPKKSQFMAQVKTQRTLL